MTVGPTVIPMSVASTPKSASVRSSAISGTQPADRGSFRFDGRDVRVDQTLAEAEDAVGRTLLWHLRVLAGWLPRTGVDQLRLLAGWFELANVDDQVHRLAGVGLGVVYQDEMVAALDNAVALPGFTRFEAGVFFTLNRDLRAQVNIENLFDEEYFVPSHSNNNISPGSPRAVRASVTIGPTAATVTRPSPSASFAARPDPSAHSNSRSTWVRS